MRVSFLFRQSCRRSCGRTPCRPALNPPSRKPSSCSAPRRRAAASCYGGAVAAAVNETDASLEIETRNTKGSTENVPLLEAGALDIALVQGEVAYEALAGVGRAPADLRILAAMYSTPGMFVVRADSPYRTIRDLVGKPVAFGARGSGLVILARYVLDGIGLDQNRDFQAVYLERAGDGPAMVMDGRVAALWGGGVGWPGFTAVAEDPAGARFITPDADEAARILARHAFLKPLTDCPRAATRVRMRRSRRSGRGASYSRGRRSPTTWPIASRAPCIGPSPRWPRVWIRRAKPRLRTRSPRRRLPR